MITTMFVSNTFLPRLNSNGCEILVRSEYRDEKVGEEIISRG